MADLPSVTRILAAVGLGPDLSMVPADLLEQARARGTAVHEAIEAEMIGYDCEVPPAAAPYLAAWSRFKLESGYKVEHAELVVRSARWRFLGHVDSVGWLSGQRVMVDFKTGEAVDLVAAARQLAGYDIAWSEEYPEEIIAAHYVLQLRGDATYRLHPVDARAKRQVFLAALTVWHERSTGQ